MKYQYWLLCLQGVGNLCKRQLIACFGSAKDLYLASEEKPVSYTHLTLPTKLEV